MMDDSLFRGTNRLFLALRAATDEALSNTGVTAAQFNLLDAIWRESGLSNADLARRCAVTPQTTHTIVNGLVAAGLVVRQPHPLHRRLLLLYLSNAGEAAVAEAEPIVAEIERRAVALLSDDERASLARMLRICAASLR